MNSLHNPERGEGESFGAYQERRARSRQAAQVVVRGVLLGGLRRSVHGKPPSSTDRERARVKAARVAAPGPKFKRERAHRPATSALRDEYGAYTLVGAYRHTRDGSPLRRKWLGGISAQRGY